MEKSYGKARLKQNKIKNIKKIVMLKYMKNLIEKVLFKLLFLYENDFLLYLLYKISKISPLYNKYLKILFIFLMIFFISLSI